ncbi:putative receptor-like protein kinase At4g00960 [Brachypodium distachyon]|uniref:Protein kinase domain-containing protein n=1 Tax=Brachypodium distachyon TaxID=15368 RepID=I1IWG1_BRADI|nr:putative receptor-like protein kinase At4g00960 [Brachypodium distachyon]KQJ81939.1 hypothetical protein BRADI_5g03937v3 [Brachypodium distachyon]|eukprot:XP_014751472.1 putative receptor-like protein kinase At4g00960 [Brachypodium distachyon]
MASSIGVVILQLLLFITQPFTASADVFCDNLKLVAAKLPNNTASSPSHFATATLGQSPDTVYAMALCRGDILGNDTACGDCVNGTINRLVNQTPSPQDQCYKASYYYGDPCTVIYSFNLSILAPFNATVDDDEPFEKWNIKNVTGDGIAGLVRRLLVDTVESAAASNGRFATGVMDSRTTFPLVRSLAQCTPDISAQDCGACLRRLLGTVNATMALRMGGQLHVVRCYFRYETYPFYTGEPMLKIDAASAPPPAPAPKHKDNMSKLWIIPVVAVPLAAAAFLCLLCYYRRLTRQRKGKLTRLQGSRRAQDSEGEEQLVWEGNNSDFSVFEFEQVLEATNNFAEENKLGEGGFGSVYKGQFPEGLEIAVKRLASHSGQGFVEFKNEVQLIAKLQHRNLVRLLGCCSQEDEKILIYEYLPNKSLDFFIFDENKRALLDWPKLVAIIEGIAHGLLYLHKHSRLRVIHRDLKPSNILLDSEMNPKISDFGLAKIFDSNNTEGNTTRRVVGTYGYMAPEYSSQGVFSIKSDVFSFGVIIFEILSGNRNSGSQQYGDFINLLGYAWQLWEEERWIDLVDASLVSKSNSREIMRCINIALLCVQENAADRPTMADVVAMLSSETMIMDEPKKPAYFNIRVGNEEASTTSDSRSINDMTISATIPR